MEIFVIIIFVVLAIGMYFIQTANHESRIQAQIESMGGKIISIERRTFSTGPFILAGKGTAIYKVEYRIHGEFKEGWVKFGGLFGPDWRL